MTLSLIVRKNRFYLVDHHHLVRALYHAMHEDAGKDLCVFVEALANLQPGGRLVVNAIRKEESDKEALLQLNYHEHLWLEREVKTVANITRFDVAEFLPIAA